MPITIHTNPEHIERTLLRPAMEEFGLTYSRMGGFDSYTIKKVEYKDGVGTSECKFLYADGKCETVIVEMKISFNKTTGYKISKPEFKSKLKVAKKKKPK